MFDVLPDEHVGGVAAHQLVGGRHRVLGGGEEEEEEGTEDDEDTDEEGDEKEWGSRSDLGFGGVGAVEPAGDVGVVT